MLGVSQRNWKWLYFSCYSILIADALFVIGTVLFDCLEEFAKRGLVGVVPLLFIIALYSYSILTAIWRKWLHSLIIYGGFTIFTSLELSDFYPKGSILLVVSSLFSIALLTVYFLISGPTRIWYGTKASLKIFGIGFISAIVLIMASLWLNMHHGPPGNTTIDIPAWLRSWLTFYGGCLLGIIAQVYSLVVTVRSHFKQINKKNKRVLLVLFWIALLILSLAFCGYATFLVIASWMV